jgi:hypothetical protein
VLQFRERRHVDARVGGGEFPHQGAGSVGLVRVEDLAGQPVIGIDGPKCCHVFRQPLRQHHAERRSQCAGQLGQQGHFFERRLQYRLDSGGQEKRQCDSRGES